MRKAALFYNPLSGRRRGSRLKVVESVSAVLRRAGVELKVAETQGPAETGYQVRSAIAEGCDVVLACGGDGTVHDILQGMIGSPASLGVIPLGTANALAHDLRMPLRPVAAAQVLLHAQPKRVAVGKIDYTEFSGGLASRYFVVTVGIGVDAHLFYALNPVFKSRLGMASYYTKATRLWMTHPLEWFEVQAGAGERAREKIKVSQVLAVRIRNFGGVLRELAPGAGLERDDLRLVLFRTRSRVTYLRYILRGLLGRKNPIKGIELVYSQGLQCRHLDDSAGKQSSIYVEADGELLGTLPAGIEVVPNALSLLMP
ncbi:MAG: hypothetical protein H0X25_14270 [Acidobacteriales bacterium]|nr:hypothetical protein [Terriglobales bacterium]